MSDVVFILGAGASRQAGAPLMADFLDKAADLLSSNKVDSKDREHFERVFEAIGRLQVVHSKSQLDLTNLESIFTTLELAGIIQQLPGFKPEAIEFVIYSLKRLIVVTLEESISIPDRTTATAPPPYPKFLELIQKIRSRSGGGLGVPRVITFNYDICVDLALSYGGFEIDYGLGSPLDGRKIVQLLKLHGSMNWGAISGSSDIKVAPVKDYLSRMPAAQSSRGGVNGIRIGSQLGRFFKEAAGLHSIQEEFKGLEPVIVPPTWNKSDYHRALSKIWAAAARSLSGAQYIYIIGYSLPETDAFFRLLYALGTVGGTPLRKIAVFNPELKVEGRFRSLLGPGALARFKFYPVTFDKAIEEIGLDFLS